MEQSLFTLARLIDLRSLLHTYKYGGLARKPVRTHTSPDPTVVRQGETKLS